MNFSATGRDKKIKTMQKSIYPCLWFDSNAKEAANFYCSVFNDAKILQDTPIVTTFEINGVKFMALNGGPKYQVSPAVSYYVYCGSDTEITRLYNTLSESGKIMMPLDKYDWSPKYAWVADKFGVNWQLDIKDNTGQHIVPCLLFANEKNARVKEALTHYTAVFENSQILVEAPYPPGSGLPEGSLLFTQFKLRDFTFNAMSSTGKHDFDFTFGNSFVVECDTQEQIDHYWNKLTEGGEESMCGWLKDKFGVAWQIVPTVLSQLMNDPEKAPKVTQAFLQMKKFDIAALLKA